MKQFIINLILILILFTSCSPTKPEDSAHSFINWASVNSVPVTTIEPGTGFADLQPLKKMVANAEIVCLGESRHDIHEQFRFKHRLVEFLVTEMNFTVFVLEENLAYCRIIDDYITTGKGDPRRILENLPMWYIWDTSEMLDLIKWMRKYNSDSRHINKIRFFGMDVTSPLMAIEEVRDYLKEIDLPYYQSVDWQSFGLDLINDNHWPSTLQQFEGLSLQEKNNIAVQYENLISKIKTNRNKYTALSSTGQYDWVLRLAESGRSGIRVFSAPDYFTCGLIRDEAMAANFKWINNKKTPGQKIMMWAHNAHINKEKVYMPQRFGKKGLISVGTHLYKEMGERMVSIGAAFNRALKPVTNFGPSFDDATIKPAHISYLDGVLSRVGRKFFLLDLRMVSKGAGKEWLQQEHNMRSQGIDMVCRPAFTFDIIYFIDTVSKAKLNTVSRSRLRAMSR